MERGNLYCLADVGNRHIALELQQIDEVQGLLEVDLENQQWKDKEWGWRKIGQKGQTGTGEVRFIFDITSREHLSNALDVAQDFQR